MVVVQGQDANRGKFQKWISLFPFLVLTLTLLLLNLVINSHLCVTTTLCSQLQKMSDHLFTIPYNQSLHFGYVQPVTEMMEAETRMVTSGLFLAVSQQPPQKEATLKSPSCSQTVKAPVCIRPPFTSD